MHRLPLCVLAGLLAGGVLASASVAADATAANIAEIDAAIAELEVQAGQARATLGDLLTQLQSAAQQRLRLERQRDAAATALEPLLQQKPMHESAAVAAQIARTRATEQAAATDTALQAVKAQADSSAEQVTSAEAAVAAAQQNLQATQQALEGPTSALLRLLESIQQQAQLRDQAQAELQTLASAADACQKSVAEAESSLAAVTAQRLEREQQLRQVLTDAGRWVSFTDEIAPILHQRCTPCHNARSSKGRLNLDSYAGLRQGGESGPLWTPGQSLDSLLCTVITDGSMPPNAAPLAPDQITLVTRWIAAGGRLDPGVESAARLLHIIPRRPQPAPPEHYPTQVAVTALAISPDGTLMATSGYHEVLLWNLADGSLQRRLPNVAQTVYGLSFHPDGQRLAIAAGTPGVTGELKVFRLTDGELLLDLVRAEDVLLGTAFSPDGSQLATCGSDRTIRTFEASTGDARQVIEDHADWVLSIDWSPDGSKLVSGSRDKTCKVFDAATGDALGTFNGHGETVYRAVFTADGLQVVSGSADKRLRVWKVADSQEVRKFDAVPGELLTLTLLPEGRVLSGGTDQLARIYTVADGKLLQALPPQADWVQSVAVHPATGSFVIGAADGRVQHWNQNSEAPLREWLAAP